MAANGWKQRFDQWLEGAIETDLTPYQSQLAEIDREGAALSRESDDQLRGRAQTLRRRASTGANADELLIDVFALVREIADRVLSMRPYDVQILAGLALHRGKLIEMQTGEGKTLAAVAPACLEALSGRGVHLLTFNDYLARRDARWMGPIYHFIGLSVGTIQEGLSIEARREAYDADVTYATAKEAGFDFLRMQLCRDPGELVQRPFHAAIVDEADSILIDEARVPLVIAGELETSEADPYKIADIVADLARGRDWEIDEHERNVQLTESGLDRVEEALACGDLHSEENYLLLTETNQALHARALLRRDVDYIVRDDRIELVDEFTGRVALDRRWPDGLQAALEAKEGLSIRPGGRILGSIALQHFIKLYPKLSGMTATAIPAAEEFLEFYGLVVVPIPPNVPCVRNDRPDRIYTHREAKQVALIEEIRREHDGRRPVLVGTSSVAESEELAAALQEAGIDCRVLNAKNDEAEAEIIARAGSLGAVTISTNMAGRGTDIMLGGPGEDGAAERERVVSLGGLSVIGTNRHESRRIDDQLRGRAGRQGDPGSSRFFICLEDNLMVRFGIDELIPAKHRPPQQTDALDHPVIRRAVEKYQRIVEGQNFDIRKTLWRYSERVERQRKTLQDWRTSVLQGEQGVGIYESCALERFEELVEQVGMKAVREAERLITLHHIDTAWREHLAHISQLREGVHLVRFGGLDPLQEFSKEIAPAFRDLHQAIEDRVVETFAEVTVTEGALDLDTAQMSGPSSTWTYLVSDRALNDLMLTLQGNYGIGAVAWIMTGPILAAWGLWRRLKRSSPPDDEK